MDAILGQAVVLVDGGRTFDATVTRVYGDDRSCVDLRYVDEKYQDPAPDPLPDGWEAPEPRAERVNATAVPHTSSAGDSPRSWRVTQPAAPKPQDAAQKPATGAPGAPVTADSGTPLPAAGGGDTKAGP